MTTYIPQNLVCSQRNGSHFANINRPTAGSAAKKHFPSGRHPLQLCLVATPNGVKVTIMLEELSPPVTVVQSMTWLIKITEGRPTGSGFVKVNPNSKIPALMDPAPQRRSEYLSLAPSLFISRRKGWRIPCP